jgi:hypothetical protein
MFIRLVWALLIVGSASVRAEGQSEEKAVLAVVERLFEAMAAHDSGAARAVLIPEGRYFSVRENGAQVVVGGATHAEFAERLAAGKEAMLERMFEPKVFIHGRIAMVWTPYDFHRNRKFSHCGVDSFSLLKTSEGWKIAGILYTVEPAGCPERPLPRDDRQ